APQQSQQKTGQFAHDAHLSSLPRVGHWAMSGTGKFHVAEHILLRYLNSQVGLQRGPMPTADDFEDRGQVTPVHNLTEFFRAALASALASQQVKLDEHTAHYVVSLLTLYSRTEVSHQDTRPGQRWVSLVDLLAQASASASAAERESVLQRLGDVSLFVAGFFAHGFTRRLIDVDYHIAMGGRAYGTLAVTPMSGPLRALSTVFGELSSKFQPVVDAIGEIAD